MPENHRDHPLEKALMIKHATRAPARPHFIAEVDFAQQYEDARQCLRLLRNGGIEVELHDWSEVAEMAHGNPICYILTIPFGALTDLARAVGYLEEGDPPITIAEPYLLQLLAQRFDGYLALRDFLRAEGIPHAIAFDSWAATPAAA